MQVLERLIPSCSSKLSQRCSQSAPLDQCRGFAKAVMPRSTWCHRMDTSKEFEYCFGISLRDINVQRTGILFGSMSIGGRFFLPGQRYVKSWLFGLFLRFGPLCCVLLGVQAVVQHITPSSAGGSSGTQQVTKAFGLQRPLSYEPQSMLWIAGPYSGWTWGSMQGLYHGPQEDPCTTGLPVRLAVAHVVVVQNCCSQNGRHV